METEKIEVAARPETTLQQLVFGVQLQVVVGARRVPLLQTVDIRSSVSVVTNFGGPLLATREFLLDPAQIRPILVTARLQVWSLTQFYSVDFSQSRVSVTKCVFNKRTIKVCVSCC